MGFVFIVPKGYPASVKILENFRRISKKHVLISLPLPCFYMVFITRFFGIRRLFKKEFFKLGINIPRFWKNKQPDGEHFWEVGYKNYPLKRIKKDIQKNFVIEKCFRNPICPSWVYFMLTKK